MFELKENGKKIWEKNEKKKKKISSNPFDNKQKSSSEKELIYNMIYSIKISIIFK